MYCRKCYADLSNATEGRCPRCGRGFDPANPRTYAARPFPTAAKVFAQVIGTTALAVVAAYVVAFQQLARSSGH
jgi:hypothetical protein